MITYEDYLKARHDLLDMVIQQHDIVVKSRYDEAVNIAESPSSTLQSISDRLKDEQLRVLVMGKFSSGKSTFLNGLLGEVLLPAKAIPTTAVIGEIRYSEKNNIRLLPKKGKWKGGDDEFSVTKEQLKDFITIDNTEATKKENPFSRMYLDWSLNICKKGIEFVDSPGLDDPDSHDDITKEYLPTADAIIYCMNATQAYSSKDSDIIQELIHFGHTSILFVLTNYDRLVENDEMMGSNDAEELIELMYKKLSPLTDLGKDGIFFVNSLAAIRGKLKNNDELLDSSGFLDLEKRMEHILVSQRGKLKLFKSLHLVKTINRKNNDYMQDSVSLLGKNSIELEKIVKEAQIPLNNVIEKGTLIKSQVQNSIKDILNNTSDKSALFLENCISKIDDWVDEHSPETSISLNPLKIKASTKKYVESFMEHIKYKMEEKASNWTKKTLSLMIKNNLENLYLLMAEKIKAYDQDLLDVRIKLDLSSNTNQIIEDKNPDAVSRLSAVAFSILTLDVSSGAIGVAYGFGSMLKSFTVKLVAMIILGIISIFNPLSLTVFIVGAIIANIGGVIWGRDTLEREVKNEIAKKTKEALQSGEKKEEIISQIEHAVKKILNDVKKQINEAIDADVNSYQKLLDDAKIKFTEDNDEIQKQLKTYHKLIEKSTLLSGELNEFEKKIGV